MTRPVPADLPEAVARVFGLEPVQVRRYGGGHINDTYLVTGARGRYVLQRINDAVFPRPVELMDNVSRVTRHVRARLLADGARDIDRRVLTLVPTPAGSDWHVDGDGQVWRVFRFIAGATSHEVISEPTQAYRAAHAFGRFQQQLADYKGPRLYETIPRFHDTVRRYDDFAAVAAADPCGRADEVREDIEWLLGQRELAGAMLSLQAEGVLPERITHNDTKLSNVLLDDATGEAVCVLDLDTVMPGLSLYDFADLCRSGATTVAEDDPDASKVDVDVPMFQALAEGYLSGAGSALLPAERELLVLAGEVMTLEQAYRFLGDHLAGDTYYQTSRNGQNLDRARTQIALVKALQRHEPALNAYVASLS
ncbi:MAG TPA: aminoglycoside phosphotransferase family protein [Propionibacteriaceae bacterium]|nr:aminoglycoside phosphotransferase family protein [Propionibacteriaceae bacterium]